MNRVLRLSSFSFSLTIFLLFGTFLLVVQTVPYYMAQYERLGVYDSVEPEEAAMLTRDLVDYLWFDDPLGSSWNEKERVHMVDVRHLFDVVRAVFVGALLIVLTFFGCSHERIMLLRRGARVGLVVVVVSGVVLLSMFSSFFTLFHLSVFSNAFWIMDPAVDLMGKLFPEAFFFHVVRDTFLVVFFLLGLLSLKREL